MNSGLLNRHELTRHGNRCKFMNVKEPLQNPFCHSAHIRFAQCRLREAKSQNLYPLFCLFGNYSFNSLNLGVGALRATPL
jgi:hypothetical protein